MMSHPSESAAPMEVQGCSISKVQAQDDVTPRQDSMTAGRRAGLSLNSAGHDTGGKRRAELTASCFAAV